jgi:hypothetical protein
MQTSDQPSLNPEKPLRVQDRMRGIGQPKQFVYVRISNDRRDQAVFEGWDICGKTAVRSFFLEEMVAS